MFGRKCRRRGIMENGQISAWEKTGMASRIGERSIQEIESLFNWGALGSRSDGQLLDQFLAGQDGSEAAFRYLIQRHGPMVQGICRRILGNDHAADDAFQATFLVLVKKAETLRDRDLLTNWLYGVTVRIAKKERSKAIRRGVVERRAADARATGEGSDADQMELRSILDEEIRRLPERYRLPLILCYLEGLRHEDVARRLDCPVGTVESRLSRARAHLRSRLARRGLAPTASLPAMIPGTLDSSALSSLIEPTLEAAVKQLARPAGVVASAGNVLIQRVPVLASRFWVSIITGTLLACLGVGAMVATTFPFDARRPGENPPAIERPHEEAAPPVQKEVAKRPLAVLADTAPESTLAEGPQQGGPSESHRSSLVHAAPLQGITIDGRLDDWPAAMPRYPVEKLLVTNSETTLGSGGLENANLSTSADLSVAFSVGYDLKDQVLYVGVIVRDDAVVVGHTSHLDTDAVEVYVDGLLSLRSMQIDGDEDFNRLELANVPVQQYIAIPGKGPVYGQAQGTNPVLIAGDMKKTRTRMAFTRQGDVITYEWAIQVFDRYPDQPTQLVPGKRIGFDLAIADKDVPATSPKGFGEPQAARSAWIYWGPPWRGMKLLDAGALGELVLDR